MVLVLRPCLRCRSDNGQIRKTGGGYKNAYISGTIGLIYFKLGQCIHEGMPYHYMVSFSW